MISQSVLPTHHAPIFPAKSTHVVKMAARIEAGASFSNWEEWNKTLENFKSCHQVEFFVLGSKSIAAAKRKLSPKVVQHPYDHKYAHAYLWLHSFEQVEETKFRTAPQSTESKDNQNRL